MPSDENARFEHNITQPVKISCSSQLYDEVLRVSAGCSSERREVSAIAGPNLERREVRFIFQFEKTFRSAKIPLTMIYIYSLKGFFYTH
jgi:hypothetical protein